MKDRDIAVIPEGEADNDIEPVLVDRALVDEPETWPVAIEQSPAEAAAPDWSDQHRPISDDPFDDDGWTDVP